MADIAAWFTGRLPSEWLSGEPTVTVDRDEILVVLPIASPEAPAEGGADAAASATAGRIARFREETREQRMRIAQEAEHHFGRKVSWGVRSGERTALFTTLSTPVMTRLRQPERAVLDTLVDAGVARSRSDALGWCVRLVRDHTEDWLAELRDALREVERLREAGPAAATG
jgi:Arc/MetJ-type ribon-helix-helix transcriptional regulator